MTKRKAAKDNKRTGNNFWERRTKHGVDKLFATPEVLWEAACEYFEATQNDPLYKVEAKVVDKSVELIELPLAKSFSFNGLCLYLGCSENYFRQFKSANRKNAEGFVTVINTISQVIFDQQYNGANAGIFNANLVSRMHGLSEKSETINTNVNITPSSDEAKAIRKAMEKRI